jgi:site-specific DNA recombinase
MSAHCTPRVRVCAPGSTICRPCFAAGDIDGPSAQAGQRRTGAALGNVDAWLAVARASSAVANLVLAGDDLRATWAASPPNVRGKVINALMTVTVLAGARGRKPGGGPTSTPR